MAIHEFVTAVGLLARAVGQEVPHVANDHLGDIGATGSPVIFGEPFHHLSLPYRLHSRQPLIGLVIIDQLLNDLVGDRLIMVGVVGKILRAGQCGAQHPAGGPIAEEDKARARYGVINQSIDILLGQIERPLLAGELVIEQQGSKGESLVGNRLGAGM